MHGGIIKIENGIIEIISNSVIRHQFVQRDHNKGPMDGPGLILRPSEVYSFWKQLPVHSAASRAHQRSNVTKRCERLIWEF